MSTYYVDPTATGANDGTSQADAWTSFGSVIGNVSAGDVVYCRGTETLSSTVTFSSVVGGAGSFIRFIGVNSSWVDDGTKFVLDANSTSASCLVASTGNVFFAIKNFEFKNATASAFTSSGSSEVHLINCSSHNNGEDGFQLGPRNSLVKGVAYNNSRHGIYVLTNTLAVRVLYSVSFGNSYGIHDQGSNACVYYRCISYNNTNYGIRAGRDSVIMGCILDDNSTDGAISYEDHGHYLFNKFTNNTTGVRFPAGDTAFFAGNVYSGNTTDKNIGTGQSIEMGVDDILNGTAGYTNQATGDYTPTASADGLNVEVDLDGTNSTFEDAGIQQTASGGGGGGGLIIHPGMNGGLNG